MKAKRWLSAVLLLAAGWQDRENVESSRIILAQAEAPEEAQELTEFSAQRTITVR